MASGIWIRSNKKRNLCHRINVQHCIAAKLFKVRVERFPMGYPPRLFGKKIGETDYCVSAIPFGGFVKISGMVDESFDKEQLKGKPKPWELRSRPWYQKFAVIFSGPFMNILFAFLVFTAAVLIYGVGELSKEPVVGNLVENMPATAADIREGDRIVSIDGTPIGSWDDLTKIIYAAPEKTLAIVWSRGDSLFSRPLTTMKTEIKEGDSMRVIGQIGISPQGNMRK